MSNDQRQVDMSSEAIDRRLRKVSELRKLGLSIAKAKRIGTYEEVSASRDDAQSESVDSTRS